MWILQSDKVTGTCNGSDICVFERRISEKVRIDAMQFGFMPGIGWKRKVSGPVLYIRRELAVIRFCATVARNGFINDVVE